MSLAQNKITYLPQVTDHRSFSELTIETALTAIKDGTYSQLVADLPAMANTNVASYRARKSKLPCWNWQGTFNGNVDSKSLALSSEIFSIDVDKLNPEEMVSIRAKLTAYKSTVAVFTSPSGKGLKALIRLQAGYITDDVSYKSAFSQISQLMDLHGITIDTSCKDVSRLCFVSNDPDLYINYEADELKLQKVTTDVQTNNVVALNLPVRQTVVSPEDTERCINQVIAKMASATPGNNHEHRLKAGKLAGGFIAAGRINQDICLTALRIASDDIGTTTPTEWATILDAVEHGKQHPLPQGWREDLQNHVDNFNETMAQVFVGGKHKIMRTMPAAMSITNRQTYEFIDQFQMKLMFQNKLIKVGEKQLSKGMTEDIMKNVIQAWAEHLDARSYPTGMMFQPKGDVPDGCFNTWQGFSVESIENEELLDKIKYHIESIVCGDNEELIEYFYNWCAFTIQNPEIPVGAALVLRGEKGTGKGVMGHFLASIWGTHSLHIASSKLLVGQFNGHLADRCFLFADEAFFSGDKIGENNLKALITEPTINIERKGIDVTTTPNYLKVFMATNKEFAVPATKDERRFGVYDVSSKMRGNTKYFEELRLSTKSLAVRSAFLYAMQHRDITQFHPGQIPDSVGLQDQRAYNLCSAGHWMMDCLTEGCFGYDNDALDRTSVWNPEHSLKYLKDSYDDWCRTNKTGTHDLLTGAELSKYLRTRFKAKLVSIKRHSGIWFGPLDAARTTFEEYEKVKIDRMEIEEGEM